MGKLGVATELREMPISVLLVPPLAAERWTCIDLYCQDLVDGFDADGRVTVDILQANPDREAGWLRRQLDFHVKLPRALGRKLHPSDPEIVHFLDQNYAYFCRPSVLESRPRAVVTCHDLAPLRQQSLRWYRHRRYRHRVSGLAWAEKIICVSANTAEDVQDLLGIDAARIAIAPLGVSSRFEPMARDAAAKLVLAKLGVVKREPWVLHVGSNDPRKNMKLLAAALAQVRQAIPSVKLVKIGPPLASFDGPSIQPGWVELRTLVAFYSLADVLVMPSSYEGFGRPLLEGMACGIPCVAAKTSALPEVGGDAVLYHPPDDAASLARSIRQILEDPALQARLSSAGRARAAGFTWRAHIDRLVSVYEELVRHGGRSVPE